MIIINKRIINKSELLPDCKFVTYADTICRCGNCPITIVDAEALFRIELLFEMMRRKITITSGFRCWIHNKNVGGIEHSDHLLGSAFDLALPDKPFIKAGLLKYLGDPIFPYKFIGKDYVHLDMKKFRI